MRLGWWDLTGLSALPLPPGLSDRVFLFVVPALFPLEFDMSARWPLFTATPVTEAQRSAGAAALVAAKKSKGWSSASFVDRVVAVCDAAETLLKGA